MTFEENSNVTAKMLRRHFGPHMAAAIDLGWWQSTRGR